MTSLAPLPVAMPLAVAALLMACGPYLSRWARDLASLLTALATAVLCGLLLVEARDHLLVYWFGGWQPREGIALGICFAIDPFGAGLALLAAVLVCASLLFSWRYFDDVGPLYPSLMLAFLGAMMGFCLTGDLFNLFVFFELMGVAAYALTGHKIVEEPAVMGAFSFAVTNSIGAFLVLTAIGLLYGRTGALNLAQMGQALQGPVDGLVLVAFVLLVCGFGIKAAQAPFHFWLADAHAVAPSPVCVLFSGVMVELGLYAIARIYWTVLAASLHDHAASVRLLWLAMSLTTGVVGAVMCFGERHLKRLLAFSTVSHAGTLLAGLACLQPDGLAGAALYLVGHGLVKGALFLATGMLLNRFGSVDLFVLRGKGKQLPLLGTIFTVAGLGLSGVPPFGTWLGKSLLEENLDRLGHSWVAPLLLATSALTGGAVLKAACHIFLGMGPREESGGPDTPRHEEKEVKKGYAKLPLVMMAPAGLLTVLALAAGLWPGFREAAQAAAARFTDRPAYAAAVLAGASATPAAPAAENSSEKGILSGLASGGAALVLALVALSRRQLFRVIRHTGERLVRLPLAGLRALHSGHLGDYVAWIVAGVAVTGGLFALLVRDCP